MHQETVETQTGEPGQSLMCMKAVVNSVTMRLKTSVQALTTGLILLTVGVLVVTVNITLTDVEQSRWIGLSTFR